jgi:hypothetical protein
MLILISYSPCKSSVGADYSGQTSSAAAANDGRYGGDWLTHLHVYILVSRFWVSLYPVCMSVKICLLSLLIHIVFRDRWVIFILLRKLMCIFTLVQREVGTEHLLAKYISRRCMSSDCYEQHAHEDLHYSRRHVVLRRRGHALRHQLSGLDLMGRRREK